MITARPWRQHGELVDLPAAVIAAGTRAGLIPVARCVALLAGLRGGRLIARPSFFQLDNLRRARRHGQPWHLIVHEDVLIFRNPEKCPSSGKLKPAQREPDYAPRALARPGSWPDGEAGQAGRVTAVLPPRPADGLPARQLRSGSLCTGYGGLDLAAMAVLGARLAWCAESDRHAAAVLAARYPDVPNLGDITPWTGRPCRPST